MSSIKSVMCLSFVRCSLWGLWPRAQVLFVNTASFQDAPGWLKLVEHPHRPWSSVIPFFVVFNAVWDLTLYSGTSCFSCTSRHLCHQSNIHLALAASSLSLMWKRWLVTDGSASNFCLTRGEKPFWGGSTGRNHAYILSLSLALWVSHSGTYFSHPTIWLLLFAADIKLDGLD